MTAVLVNFIRLLATVLWFLLIARVRAQLDEPDGAAEADWSPSSTRRRSRSWRPSGASCRPTGGIDWSPLIAMLILGAIVRVAVNL